MRNDFRHGLLGVALHPHDGGRSGRASTTPDGELPWFGGVAMRPGTASGLAVGGGSEPAVWRT